MFSFCVYLSFNRTFYPFVSKTVLNFLAHIALSGTNQEIAIGNFIADSILPKERNLLSSEMQKGIPLHQAIDQFTDAHPSFKNTVSLIRPSLRKYAPVATDVYYDHFLAKHFQRYYPAETLQQFSAKFYSALALHEPFLPGNGKHLAHYIIQYDWLNMYASAEGLHKILCQMASRTRFESNLELATDLLLLNYSAIEQDFNALYPDLMQLCATF